MNIKKRLKNNQPEEYSELKEYISEEENIKDQDNNILVSLLLWLDSLMDKPIDFLLELRKKIKLD